MQLIGSLKSDTRRRVFDSGEFRGFTDYLIDPVVGTGQTPQAFLAHQQAGWTLRTHYHHQEQFQVAVRGGGMLGRHPLEALSVHYASRESGYGPLVAGPVGLDYLTLRSCADMGAQYLPESQSNMRRGLKKRQETIGPIPLTHTESLSRQRQSQLEILIAPDASGLAAWIGRLGPLQTLIAPHHPRSGGRFYVVVAGLLLYQEPLRPPSCVYAAHDDPPLTLQSGADGLEILILQYPDSALQERTTNVALTNVS